MAANCIISAGIRGLKSTLYNVNLLRSLLCLGSVLFLGDCDATAQD